MMTSKTARKRDGYVEYNGGNPYANHGHRSRRHGLGTKVFMFRLKHVYRPELIAEMAMEENPLLSWFVK